MARIRIVDDWLRSPASPPSHYRSVMVVAEQWAEQRVLMRAYAECRDQSRPTIVLHGEELAIGPAGTDGHGPWGIHVMPPGDGRAQQLKEQLELAARRMAGTRGNPPRLEDEVAAFDRKPTNNWAPGAPRDLPGGPRAGYFEPAVAASQRMPAAPATPMSSGPMAAAPPVAYGTPAPGPPVFDHGAHEALAYAASSAGAERLPVATPAQRVTPPAAHRVRPPTAEPAFSGPVAEYVSPSSMPTPPSVVMAASDVPEQRLAPVPLVPSPSPQGKGRASPTGARTAVGYSSGSGAQSAVVRLGLRPGVSQRLGRIAAATVPADFEVTPMERTVLNALGETDRLTARAIGQLTGIVDPMTWMDRLMDKLSRHGLDIVAPGEPDGAEPTYVLRR